MKGINMERNFKFNTGHTTDYFAHVVGDTVIVSWIGEDGNIACTDYSKKSVQGYLDGKSWKILGKELEIEEISAQEAMDRLEQMSGKKIKIVSGL
jgi:hypothetical protein